MALVLPCSISIILQSHTGRRTQCSQDSRCDRCNQLHNKLGCLFLIHIFLLSLLILGTVPKTEPAPKILIIRRLVITGWARDDAAATA